MYWNPIRTMSIEIDHYNNRRASSSCLFKLLGLDNFVGIVEFLLKIVNVRIPINPKSNNTMTDY